MKKISYFIFFMFMLIIIIPFLILNTYKIPNNIENSNKEKKYPKIQDIKETNNINVYFHNEDIVSSVDFDTYLKGVVGAEMPALFEIEALKAQAVAARTYTLYKILNNNDEQKKYHKGGDICTNYVHCQAWKSNNELKESWGFFGYFKYFEKISRAVDETKDMVIVYDNELINPLFHSTSTGKTENSEEVFATMLPYLRSVESNGEEESPKFSEQVVISFNEFKQKLNTIANDLTLSKMDIANIEVIERSEGGRIKKIRIGNKIFDGKQIRSIMGLNSTDFKIKLTNEKIIIDTIGYGHGVGMSQFGANYLAKSGNNYDYILKHYYKGIDIVSIKELKK